MSDLARSIAGDDRTRIERMRIIAFNRRRAAHYRACFLADDGGASIDGQKVLADLRRFCRLDQPTFDPDARVHALLEGRREVGLRILAMLDLSSAETAKFVEVRDE